LSGLFFNHHSHAAHSWWDRYSFVANWWRIYDSDPYWAPPDYPTLRRALEPGRNPHLARQNPLSIHTEALPQRQRSGQEGWPSLGRGLLIEQPVAAAVVLRDPRRRDGVAYLALLRCVNDAHSLEKLLDYIAEMIRPSGYRKIIGPTGLSPYLGSGLLQNHWNKIPPLHTPYAPPYMPEIMGNVMRVRSSSRLFRLEIPAPLPDSPPAVANLQPLHPTKLINDLLPLLVAACPPWLDFAPPDGAEAAFLLRWLGRWPLFGWLAKIKSEPVGFVLLQPNLSPRLRRAKGGRNLLWRLWLSWAARRPTPAGRVLLAGVLPQWQKQGVGRQLLHQALVTAQQQGWQSLTIGPLPTTAPGSQFLERMGAQPRQSYILYQTEL